MSFDAPSPESEIAVILSELYCGAVLNSRLPATPIAAIRSVVPSVTVCEKLCEFADVV